MRQTECSWFLPITFGNVTILLLPSSGYLLFSYALGSVSAILHEELRPSSAIAMTQAAAWVTVSNEPLIGNHENCFVMASNKKAYLTVIGRTYKNTCAYDPADQTWDCTPHSITPHAVCSCKRRDLYSECMDR